MVGFYERESGRPSMTWPESGDEALCSGWIDGVRRRIDDESYSIRFTPRRQSSIRSKVNVEKIAALKRRFGVECHRTARGYEAGSSLRSDRAQQIPNARTIARENSAWNSGSCARPSRRK